MISRIANRFAALSVLFLISACMSSGIEIPERELKPEERMYVGQIFVELNGKPAKKCELYINSDIMPYIRVPEDGWIAYKTDRTQARFSRIACYQRLADGTAAWHHQEIPLLSLSRPPGRAEITAFGSVQLAWTVDDQATQRLVRDPSTPRQNNDVHINPSGSLTVKVTSNLQEARAFYAKGAAQSPTRNYEWREVLVEAK